ncbi:hypothetical protein DC083_03365 [Ignatzschineria ureiclastica]|uniref:Uncharacterized protein n=1 Tax=Ignatzschineria ureiclastica TaxID=472582 RepID=A0A2U2AFZ6_9GAMM|nr:hypothetical protein [Ignatzschineria ureiclastica]PWD81499.1 hypothetical protein DC083_03365 [Ignatzschineria ureiclastica]
MLSHLIQRDTKVLITYPLLTIILTPVIYWLATMSTYSLPIIEIGQLILLIAGAFVSLYFATKDHTNRIFWLWAMIWWLILAGRSINWGRLYIPGYPREYYRAIGATLILFLSFPFWNQRYRRSFLTTLKTYGIPCKIIVTLAILFLMIDQIEQQRLIFQWLKDSIPPVNTELLEEIVELFFIVCLFECIRFYRRKITY